MCDIYFANFASEDEIIKLNSMQTFEAVDKNYILAFEVQISIIKEVVSNLRVFLVSQEFRI